MLSFFARCGVVEVLMLAKTRRAGVGDAQACSALRPSCDRFCAFSTLSCRHYFACAFPPALVARVKVLRAKARAPPVALQLR